jgi:hypothetical protein
MPKWSLSPKRPVVARATPADEAGHIVAARLLGYPLGGRPSMPGRDLRGVWGEHHIEAFAEDRGASGGREIASSVVVRLQKLVGLDIFSGPTVIEQKQAMAYVDSISATTRVLFFQNDTLSKSRTNPSLVRNHQDRLHDHQIGLHSRAPNKLSSFDRSRPNSRLEALFTRHNLNF